MNLESYPYNDLAVSFAAVADSLEKGGALVDSLRAGIEGTSSGVLKTALQEMIDGWLKEEDIVPPMRAHSEIFPPIFLQCTRIGFASGTLEKMWRDLAEACRLAAEEEAAPMHK